MKKVLLVALTHQNAFRLARLIWAARTQFPANLDVHGMVVCNSTDPSYAAQAQQVAQQFNWMFRETTSNGMPGKGKNSVLDIFSKMDGYDYLFLVDGDDFLYPTAFQQIEQLLRIGADVVGFLTNDIIDNVLYKDQKREPLTSDLYLYSWFDDQVRWPAKPELTSKLDLSQPLGQQTTPDRIVLLSKKAAVLLRCSEKLPVYEDYVLSLRAKAAMLRGELSYVQSGTTYAYVYDKTNDNSVCKQFDREYSGNWSSHDLVFREELGDDLILLLKSSPLDVPFVEINHPKAFDTNGKIQFLRYVLSDQFNTAK